MILSYFLGYILITLHYYSLISEYSVIAYTEIRRRISINSTMKNTASSRDGKPQAVNSNPNA